ncbi:VanZ family protein [Ornithinibacillus sp. L9]|uniref:VanZ family protein n=1 Tax=Ornithinibacillus caprae TaxID=2678566 RepID=A0A6N8FJ57_9BACI|nr:VanZ family protein [Ornithinibacillus caprae]MUK89495.1 VanZ family protein [Ornithinibacillus caprae]
MKENLYIIDGSLLVVLGTFIYLVYRGLKINRERKKINRKREVILLFFILYMLLVVSVTLFPLHLWIDFKFENISNSLNLVPILYVIHNLKMIGTAYGGDSLFMVGLIIRNVGGNILLFMPLGLLTPMIWKRFRIINAIILLSLSVSISIESLQFIEILFGQYGRVVDIDDIIFNVLGAILGYAIYKVVTRIAKKYSIKLF